MAFSVVWDIGTRFLTLVRRVDRLFELQTRVDASLDIPDQRLRAVEDRLLRLESEGPHLITEARSAASAAATAMSAAALSDLVTRLTRVEVRLEGSPVAGTPRISAPKKAGRKTGDGDQTVG